MSNEIQKLRQEAIDAWVDDQEANREANETMYLFVGSCNAEESALRGDAFKIANDNAAKASEKRKETLKRFQEATESIAIPFGLSTKEKKRLRQGNQLREWRSLFLEKMSLLITRS